MIYSRKIERFARCGDSTIILIISHSTSISPSEKYRNDKNNLRLSIREEEKLRTKSN